MFNTSHSTYSISIFDIPLVVDLICDYLSKRELLPCLEVSRHWRSVFRPQVLRCVEFVNLKSHQTWVVLDRAARIRSLTIDICDGGWFLNRSISCTNLKELHCVDYNYLPERQIFGTYPNTTVVDQNQNALLLLTTNPSLQTFTVSHDRGEYRVDHFTETVFKSLVAHRSLTKVHISINTIAPRFLLDLFNSLPVNLQDFEFSCNNFWNYDPVEWESFDANLYTTSPLPFLERCCLSGPQKRVTNHWQEDKFFPSMFTPPRQYEIDFFYDSVSTAIVRRSPQLKDFCLRGHCGDLKWLVRLLVNTCPDLESIEIASREFLEEQVIENEADDAAALSEAETQETGPYFKKLREFRLKGEMTLSTKAMITQLVSLSHDTLEIVWFDHGSEHRTDHSNIRNPFHINDRTSWTQCRKLRELVLYQEGGLAMKDYRWDAPNMISSGTLDDCLVTEDYSSAFDKLEKLRLSIIDPCWKECNHGCHNKLYGNAGWWDDAPISECWDITPYWGRSLGSININHHEQEQRRMKLRCIRIAFILQVREIYGRLKDLKHLRALEIEWCACSVIRNMTLEQAMNLFCETELDEDMAEGTNFQQMEDQFPRTRKGWWGPITSADLSWLGLSWPSQVETTKVDFMNQCLVAKMRLDNNYPHTAYAQLADPFRRRVGRCWEDWMYLVGACRVHWSNRASYRWGRGCSCRGDCDDFDIYTTLDGYDNLDHDHVVFSKEFETFCHGMVATNGARWKNIV
ncbi:hypothetical protein FBU30_004777 [Linnemannia zychae]|nr:hypothetical protein FBU30_004777 [Linnemannia zychae]